MKIDYKKRHNYELLTTMKLSLASNILIVLFFAACIQPLTSHQPSTTSYQTTTIARDLLGPVGLAQLPDGSLLIAEEGNGDRDSSAGVTLVTSDGEVGRLISGLFSTRDAGDLAGVPLVSISPDKSTIYVANFGQDHLWTLPVKAFMDSDGYAQMPAEPFLPGDLGQAMSPLNNVRLTNPFDMTYDAHSNPVVSDASQNGIATTNSDGTTRFFHRFDRLPNPVRATQPVEAVPTGIINIAHERGEEYFVTLFGGCPYPEGSGQLVAIDTSRNQRTILDGLNLPIDIAIGSNGALWLLEFARFTPNASCFDGSGYRPNTGRLSLVTTSGETYKHQTIIDNLNYPGAVLPASDGSLYISEVLSGRVIHITFPESFQPMAFVANDQPVRLVQQDYSSDSDLSVPTIEGQHSALTTEATLEEQSSTQARQLESTSSQQRSPDAQFVNMASESGLNFNHGAFHNGLSMDPVAAMGAGLCWIDYNRDGWLDLYLVNSYSLDEADYWEGNGSPPTNALFRNRNGQFEDVSRSTQTNLAMRGNGCVVADFNLDSWPDIYITAHGPNALLWNNGDGTFTNAADVAGVSATEGGVQPEWNSAASVGDLNGDGWPDLFVAGYIDLSKTIPKPTGHFPQDFYGIPDRLFLNQGIDRDSGFVTFREITVDAGLTRAERGLGSLFTDLDLDGDLDLYIANDGHPNRLYANESITDDPLGIGFRFVDQTETADIGDSGSGMGVTNGDYDGDGALDLFVTNWDTELNALYRNLVKDVQENTEGLLTFQYSTYRIGISGLGNNLTGWGTHLIDVDHDTDLDVITVNGHVPITDFAKDAQLVRYYRNRSQTIDGSTARPGQFLDWTKQAELDQIGPLMARGSSAADYDNDGDLDIAINTIGGAAVLLQSQTIQPEEANAGNWIILAPERVVPGLRVVVTLAEGRQLVREVLSGSSYLASEDPRIHFGLGKAKQAANIEIMWPNGEIEVLMDIGANQIVRLK